MKCRHLNQFRLSEFGWTVESCKASKRPYAPTIFELNHYCNRAEDERCHILREKESAFENSGFLFENTISA